MRSRPAPPRPNGPGRRSASASWPRRSASSRWTSSCCWSRSPPTSTRASSASTGTSTTTSPAAGRASAWRSSCAAARRPRAAPRSATGSGPLAPLVAGRLLIIEDVDRPILTRPLRVPDRVTAHLLGDDSPDPIVEALLATSVAVDVEEVDAIERTLAAGRHLVYVRERPGSVGALARLDGHGPARPAGDRARPRAHVAGRRPGADRRRRVARGAAARRGARRRAGRVARRARGGRGPRVRRAPGTVILVGTRDWDPAWSREPPLIVDAPVPTVERRHELWVGSLNGDAPKGFDPAAATIAFRLTPEQIDRAARAARQASTAARAADDDRGRVRRRPRAERRRPRAAGAPDRADRRLGRPRAPRRSSRPSCAS